jgi:uncharacterized membrane protein YbaN (DUF454 family)
MNVTMDNLLLYILLAFLVYTFFFEKKSEGFEKISKEEQLNNMIEDYIQRLKMEKRSKEYIDEAVKEQRVRLDYMLTKLRKE